MFLREQSRLLLCILFSSTTFASLLISTVRNDVVLSKSIDLTNPEGVDCKLTFIFGKSIHEVVPTQTSRMKASCSPTEKQSRNSSNHTNTSIDPSKWHMTVSPTEHSLLNNCSGITLPEPLSANVSLCIGIVYQVTVYYSYFGKFQVFNHTFINTPECLTSLLPNQDSSECQCPYTYMDFNDFDFTPNNVSVARVDFDGAGANGTAIVSWTMPIPAHLQGCFYCSVTCQKESKVGRRPCDYPPPPSLARCGQYYSPFGYNAKAIPSLLITGLEEDQTYFFSVHVYLPYPDPVVLAHVIGIPTYGWMTTTSKRYVYHTVPPSDDGKDFSQTELLAITLGTAGLIVIIVVVSIVAWKCKPKHLVLCQHTTNKKYDVKTEGGYVAVGDNATVVSQQSSGKVVDGDGQKELKNKNHGGSQTQTNYDVSVAQSVVAAGDEPTVIVQQTFVESNRSSGSHNIGNV